VVVGLLVAACAGADRASAQAWVESGDAGDGGIAEAQLTHGAGPLLEIVGDLADSVDVDLYCIRVTDEAAFSASTVGGASFDTALFLFDIAGNPVAFNDDDVDLQSTIDSTLVTRTGLYFLAVCSFGATALDESGTEMFSSGPGQIPPAPCPGPSRPDCNTFRGRLAGFLGGSEAGAYSVALNGAGFLATREGQCLRVPSGAYPTVQSAVNAAVNGDTVLVAPGSYSGQLVVLDKLIAVRAERGPTETTIDGAGAGVTTLLSGDIGPLTVLEGFTITDSLATPPNAFFALAGAPTVRDCRFVGPKSGAAVAVLGTAAPTLERCTVQGTGAGACSVTAGADARIVSSLITNNSGSMSFASGVYAESAGTVVELFHTTISASSVGPALRSANGAAIRGVHSIVWANPGGDFAGFDPNTAFKRSIFVGASAGNIASSPLFQNATAGDFRPAPGSPALDASQCANLGGNADTARRILGTRDLDGRARFVNAVSVADTGTACAGAGAPDIGCYEASAGVGASALAACLGDANFDQRVDFDDIIATLGAWLSVCP